MITITAQAARQIRNSSEQSGTEGMSLRLAARREADGTIEYGMGFDDHSEGDHVVSSEGITLLISPQCADLLEGATLDFVEINAGNFCFIFMNPNDASHQQPGMGQEAQD